MKKVFFMLILACIFTTINVYATNDVSYKLKITKDYDFIEEITYSISDSKQVENGYNYFESIINDDVFSDITYRNKYKKKITKKNGKQIVVLTHTYSEYGMNNANFLNNCYEEKSFSYNSEEISFNGKKDFVCLNGDSLKIQLITDFEVLETNAKVSGNTYTWYPKDNNFKMNIKIKKVYEESEENEATDKGMEQEIEEIQKEKQEDIKTEEEIQKENAEKEKKSNSKIYIFLSIIGISTLIIVATILKVKNSNLNKI